MAQQNPVDVSNWTVSVNGEVWTPRRNGNLLSRALLQLEQQLQRTRKKPSVVSTGSGKTTIISAGLPKQVLSVSATQTASKQQDRTFSLVSVSFTRNPGDTNFAGARVWFKGYKGSTQWELVASGQDSPISFLEEATGETVQVAVQAFNASNIGCDFSGCPITTVKLSGVTSAPPAPTVSQNVVPVVGGFQFTFTLEAGLLADVIDSYKVYRNTVNNSGTATVCQTIKHPQSNNGSYVVQDYPGGDAVYFYWVSAVNTVGLESTLTAAQSSTQSALANQRAFGKNLVPNPGFESNTLGTALNSDVTFNYPVVDGWLFPQNDNSLGHVQLQNSGAHSGANLCFVGLQANVTVPANSTSYCGVWSSAQLPLAVGDIVRCSAWLTFARTATPPAGLTVTAIFGLVVFNQAGTQLGTLAVTATSAPVASMTFYQSAVTVPATLGGGVPAYARFFVQEQYVNTNGSGVATGSNLYGDARFDDVRCVIQNTAFDLTPVSTSGTFTSGAVLSQSGTTTTINVASSSCVFGDGTVTYNSGSVNPGSYGTWYVYASDPTYSGGAVTYLTTATYSDTFAANGYVLFGKITTNSGGTYTQVTAGSGGGRSRL